MQRRQHTVPMIVTGHHARPLQPIGLDAASVSESFLQDLLFQHPHLLPIDEIEPIFADPLVLARELRTPAGPLDLLYMNAEGFITLVETKLWRNPEARRTVVGQIIDYAKHLSTWSYTILEEHIQKTPNSPLTANQPLVSLFTDENDPAEDAFDERRFITNVERNLRLGRFLLLIAGDGIHEGVEQMAEFLNQTPRLGFNLALVEMPLFRLTPDDDTALLITPRVVARTREVTRAVVRVEVIDGKVTTDVRIPDDDTAPDDSAILSRDVFLSDVEERDGETAREFLEWVLAKAEERDLWLGWGKSGVSLWYSPDGEHAFGLTGFRRQMRGGRETFVGIGHVTEMCHKLGIDKSIGTDLIDEVAAALGGAKRIAYGRGKNGAALRLNNGKRPRIADLAAIREAWLAAIDRAIDRLDAAFENR